MGIPYYFYVLMKTYPNIIHTSVPDGCSDFFVDFNGAIHHAANIALKDPASFSETAVLDRTWEYLQTCTGIANPSRMVHICTDGVAPIAKMYQQRKRRYIAVWKNKATAANGTPAIWDRNAISPGTPFMNLLQAYIARRIRDRENHRGMAYYFSGADEAGEGEHKIFARISSLAEDGGIIIHGLDADLIMLSLISHHRGIFLMREPMGAYKDMETNEGFMYVDIDRLRTALLKDLKTRFHWPVGDTEDIYSPIACNVIETYVTICSILGNDFLPHPVTLPLKKHGYDKLLHAAKHAWDKHGALFQTDVMNYPFITEVFLRLADSEDTDMWKHNEEYLKRKPFDNEEDPLDPYPLQNKDPLCNLIYEGNPHKWRQSYYKHLFHTRMHDTTVISSACDMFVRGMIWVHRYYKRLPKDPEWYYPYNYSPSIRDLANFMLGCADHSKFTQRFKVQHSKGYVHPYVQLLCIMPRDSAPILPRKVREVMCDEKGACAHMFPTGFSIQTYMKTHLWECTPVLPILDVALFERELKIDTSK